MKQTTRTIKKWIGALAIAALAPTAMALPFTNGGFTTGDAPWNPSGNAFINDTMPRTGLLSLEFSFNDGTAGSVLQTFDGLGSLSSYHVSFYIKGDATGFIFTVDGLTKSSLGKPTIFTLVDGDFFADAGGAATMSLSIAGATGNLFVDDISITQNCSPANPCNNVPEPGSLLLVGAALAAGALVRRRKQA